jgi:hypothetical protein
MIQDVILDVKNKKGVLVAFLGFFYIFHMPNRGKKVFSKLER